MTLRFTILPILFSLFLAGATYYVKERRAQDAAGTSPAPFSEAIAPVGVLVGGPSLTAAQIDSVLEGYGSPAAGAGAAFYEMGIQYGIDDAYALAFFVHESSAGTNPAWAGFKPDGTTTHNLGNIICAGYPTCYGRFRDYPTWRDGIEGWYRLIKTEYIQGRGHRTVGDVIPVYAPSFENDVSGYINSVNGLVETWREETQVAHAPRVSSKCVDPIPDWQQHINPNARFYTINCDAWGMQSGCQHFGTDIGGQGEGTPVNAPCGGTYIRCQDNGDSGPYIGKWIEYTADDGAEFLINHFRDSPLCGMAAGARIEAGAFLGTMRGDANHVHVQVRVGGGLVDFEDYMRGH